MRLIIRVSPFSKAFASRLYRGGIGAFCSAAISMSAVSAADIPVNRVDDSGAGSLRQGMSDIQAGDRLVFQSILNGTTLVNGAPLTLKVAGTMLDSNSILVTDNHAYQLSAPLTVDWAGKLTLNGVLSDGTATGSLVKTGLGTLILNNSNTYTGGTTINGGTLQISTNSGLGTGALTVGSSAGAATLVLGSGLTLSNAITLQAALNVNSSAGAPNVLSGVISGGTLNTTGTGTLILSGTNTFTGGVHSTANSKIIIQNNSALGTGTLSNAGLLTLDLASGLSVANKITMGNALTANVDSGSATLSGAIGQSTASSFTKTGSGNLILTGATTYTGGTIINAGTLTGNTTSLSGKITNNASLIFNQTGTGTFAGTIDGTGTMTKTGNGTLIFSGNSSSPGAFAINSGEFQANGSVSGAVNIISTLASLTGTGSVGSVTNNGYVQPGTSAIGNLNVNGDFTQQAAGITEIKVNSSGNAPGVNNDHLNITGKAHLGGALNIFAVGGGTYTAGTQYTIMNAAGGVTGQFAQTSSNLSMFGIEVLYGANDVKFELLQTTSLRAAALTGNQISVGTALDQIALTSTGSLFSMINSLGVLSPAQQRQSMNQLSGQTYGNLQTIGLQIGDQFQQKLNSMMVSNAAFLAGGEPVPTYSEEIRGQSPTGDLGRGWVQGFGVSGNLRSDGNGAGGNYGQGGALFGIDGGRDETGFIGVAGGTSFTQFHDDFGGKGNINSYQVGMYALKHDETGYLLGSANYGYNDYSTNRSVTISNATQLLHGDFYGNQIGTYAETGLKLSAGPIYFQPLVGLQYLFLDQQRFKETGGPAALAVSKENANALRLNVGARMLLEPWVTESGVIWSPYSHIRYVADLLDNDRSIGASFIGSPSGGSFTTQGTHIGPNYGVVGEGLEIRISDYWSLFGGADVMMGDHITMATGSFGSLIRW